MSDQYELAVVPGPRDDFIELARTKQGRLFRKQILRPGTYPHPADSTKKLSITPEKIDTMVRNFDDGVCDIVQVPKVDASNVHVEDPDRNIGEVIRLEKRTDGGLDAIIDARSEDDAAKLGKTLLGVSAMFHENYVDTRTGERRGPTLLHTAITNRPFITGLDGFQEAVEDVVAASRADTQAVTVYAAQEDPAMPTKEEMIQALKDEHGIDVEALQTASLSADDVVDTLVQRGIVTLSNEGDDGSDEPTEISTREVAEAAIELANKVEAQDEEIARLAAENLQAKHDAAEREVAAYVEEGKILPKQAPVYVELAMNDRTKFEALLPEDSIVQMSEQGVTVHDDPDETTEAETARLAAAYDPNAPKSE